MSRIYIVTPTKKLPETSKPRMIRAANSAQAVKFATSEFYTCDVATAETAAELAGTGVKIEDAGAGE